MTQFVMSIVIAQCISSATLVPSERLTEIHVCNSTVKVDQRTLSDRYYYAKYADNYFYLRHKLRLAKTVAARQ